MLSRSAPPHCRSSRGFTVLEILVVALIIAILATISFPMFSIIRAKAEDHTCSGNLKTLHIALNNYILDHHQWPQVPHEFSEDEEKVWKWFAKELEASGADKKHWMCPTHYRSSIGALPAEDRPEYWSSYIPTQFDDHAMTPFRWRRQPWMMERGPGHGNGVKMLMQDSSIERYNGPGL